ncbi:capsid protein [Dromedary astrovirus]|uniref:capsid protein n=1 Tax=Dromedary astrovirus TaxID=1662272 RepID=UPI00067A5E34|nr:capsid protein [Dromedary astrovirus]AKK25320.1 capsid protein [Dromedary astrovirus]
MANRQQKRQPRTTTNIVVRNGTTANQAGSSQAKQARRRRSGRKPQVNVRVLSNQSKVIRKFPRRQGIGNRVVFQKINSTLGTVGSNGSEQIECELTCLMNPATMKEATGSNSFSPLGIYSSTYTLFKMTRCTLVLKPLVGPSAVSGTVTRVSWNPTSTPTQTSWSALGARKHVDVTPGKTGRFTLTAKDLVGPKGGWFKTNTKGDPMMSFAGTLEIHTLGKTMSTYQNTPFSGGLFLAELETQWQFKDYGQQPGMLNLIKGEDTQNATITTDGNGKLQLVVPNTTRMARAADGTTSEIIWVVTDTVINLGASVFPPPFSWLIRGGWWIVKRAAGAPVRSGETTFDIYASISDARADMPCISTQANAEPITVGGLHFQQLTPGNTGIGIDQQSVRVLEPQPQGPTQCYVVAASMLKMGQSTAHTDNTLIPSYCAWFTPTTTQNNNTGIGFSVGNTVVATYNIRKVVATTDVGGIQTSLFANRVPIKLYFPDGSRPVGYAVAAYHAYNQQASYRISTVLFYAENTESYNFEQNWLETRVSYPVRSYQASISTSTPTLRVIRMRVEAGNWYVAQYAVHGVIEGQYTVGDQVIAFRANGSAQVDPTDFTPSASDAINGMITSYATELRVFTSQVVSYDNGAREVSDLDPSFGCDDVFEDPIGDTGDDTDDEFYGDDADLELEPGEHYSDPPISRLVVHPEVQQVFENLKEKYTEREARLAANQLKPSDEYTEFISVYHDALADGLSPRDARAHALGL